jgi:hypothetical protein
VQLSGRPHAQADLFQKQAATGTELVDEQAWRFIRYSFKAGYLIGAVSVSEPPPLS